MQTVATFRSSKPIRAEIAGFVFILIHLLCWTIIPIVVRANLPLDSIEGTIWGHQLEWGYDKNPFLNGWLTALAVFFSRPSGWLIYFFSQLSVAISFYATWQLAKRILSPSHALIAMMMLEGLQYFNLHAIDFNDNTLELSLWSLTIYFFYCALQTKNSTRNWLLTGIFAGFGMMAKYYTAALLAAMFFFLLFDKTRRKTFQTGSIYLGLAAMSLIMLPHIVWLFFHDFVTIHYVFERTNAIPNWRNHLSFPVQFAYEQLQVFIPVIILFVILMWGKAKQIISPRIKQFDLTFLFYMAMGPFLLTILLSICTGIKLRAGWGMPLLTLWPTLLLAILHPNLSFKKISRLMITIYTFLAALLIAYIFSITHSKDTSSANFPGKEMADIITEKWHTLYQTPLSYVGGARWLSGNIEFYSKDHPSVFINWDKRISPWINEADLVKHGSIYVWDLDKESTLPKKISALKPEKVEMLTLNWQRDHHHLPPVRIGLAFFKPLKNINSY